jgi:hypothetical protein
MKDRVLAALLTVCVFGAGFLAGWWHERTRPVPPPPGAFLGEFGRKAGAPRPPINRELLISELAKFQPQVEAFKARMAEIDTQFDHDLTSLLTAEQKARRDDWLKRHPPEHHPQKPESSSTKPLTDDEIADLLQRPVDSLVGVVVVPMRLDQLTQRWKLDDSQREQVRDLLRVRREKFLELVDSAPPPSLTLTRLAPVAQRLAAPAAMPASTAVPAH